MARHRNHRGFTLIELMIVVVIIGILAAIAIPNFARFQARARRAEAKANLKALFTAQRSVYSERSRYEAEPRSVGFSPERGNRYMYALGTCAAGNTENRDGIDVVTHAADVCIGADKFRHTGYAANGLFTPLVPTGTAWPAGSSLSGDAVGLHSAGGCTDCGFLAAAAGNVDEAVDDGADTWVIASGSARMASRCPGGAENVPAGEPFNAYSDVDCD